MSIEYELKLATKLNPETALRLIAQEYGFAFGEQGNLQGPGIVVGAIAIDEQSQSFMEEMFQFRPTVNIWFCPDPNGADYLESEQVIVGATSLLFNKESGDAVLLHNGENLLLQRRNGEVAISDKWWSDWFSPCHLTSEIMFPYTVRNLPSPLL
jgi:hypothetical protein